MAVAPPGGRVLQRLSRRSVLFGLGGFALALGFGEAPAAFAASPGRGRMRPNAWITIDADDLVTLISPASEMGQGVMTSIPLLLAEEMDADWRKVRVRQAPSDAKTFGNPAFRPTRLTFGGRFRLEQWIWLMRSAG
jgi:isoquinoline 1-oxidoreductase beta subunit